MPTTCILMLLDGLGDRSHPCLNHRTPLQAAATPNLDRLATTGGLGLYHAGLVGQPLPSEDAHWAMFGQVPSDFPGRGPLEALGWGMELAPDQVAVLVHLGQVERVPSHATDKGEYRLVRDVPDLTPEEAGELTDAIASFESQGISIRYHAMKGTFGVLTLTGQVSPWFTDTGVMVEGLTIPAIQPHAAQAHDKDALRTCRVLTEYALHSRNVLREHPVNLRRKKTGRSIPNFVLTQRPGWLRAPSPLLLETHGLKALSISGGAMYRGLCRHLGIDHIQAPATGDTGADYAAALRLAREHMDQYDFIHVHTKAPDQAAHTKNPEAKVEAIEALDRAIGEAGMVLADDEYVLLVVAADHSTPSHGPLIHCGEPVPVLFHGGGVRRDTETRFDEIAAARGALGTLRGEEFLLSVLNALDRTKLKGIMDVPEDRPHFPGKCLPFPTALEPTFDNDSGDSET